MRYGLLWVCAVLRRIGLIGLSFKPELEHVLVQSRVHLDPPYCDSRAIMTFASGSGFAVKKNALFSTMIST